MTSEKLCECGCGQKTLIARHTDHRSQTKRGEPRRFVHGHGTRLQEPHYELRDLGYKTPCWIWLHGKNKGGYGRISGPKYAHVIYYEQANGPVPTGLTVDHVCHNADKTCPGGPCIHHLCVNPEHLQAVPVGTNTRRGRATKLTPEDVRAIRATPRRYGNVLALAKRYGVSVSTINNIVNHADRCWPGT